MKEITGCCGGTSKDSLSIISKFLTLWILLAMAVGIILGAAYPQVAKILDAVRIEQVSLPIAIGLIWMMYPPLAGVKYEELSKNEAAGESPECIHCPELDYRSCAHVRSCLDIPS